MKKTVFAFFAILTVLSVACPVQADEKLPTCAVLTFEAGAGIRSNDVHVLSDRFSAELDRLGRFTLMSRDQMSVIMDAQRTSRLSSDDPHAIEAGKLLAIRHIIHGSVGRIGDRFVISVKLTDVETGATLRSVSWDGAGKMDDLLRYGLASAAKRLLEVKDEDMPSDRNPGDPATSPVIEIRIRTPMPDDPIPSLARSVLEDELALAGLQTVPANSAGTTEVRTSYRIQVKLDYALRPVTVMDLSGEALWLRVSCELTDSAQRSMALTERTLNRNYMLASGYSADVSQLMRGMSQRLVREITDDRKKKIAIQTR